MALSHVYEFKRVLDPEKVEALKRDWRWFGPLEIDGCVLRSERPIPPKLYEFFERLSEVKTSSLDLYQACREAYTQVLTEGEKAFPVVYDKLQRYGFSANCVLAEMINMQEATQKLGRETARKLLSLSMGRSIQLHLFE